MEITLDDLINQAETITNNIDTTISSVMVTIDAINTSTDSSKLKIVDWSSPLDAEIVQKIRDYYT